MYYTSLPDHTQPGFDEKTHFSQFGRQNILFNARASKIYDVRHVGCLSLKRILSGEEWYGVDGQQLAARPGKMLILNNGQDYTCRVDTAGEVRIQSIFFKTSFATAIFHDALTSERAQLDDPTGTDARALEFFQKLYNTDPLLEKQLAALFHMLDKEGYAAPQVDEHLVFLLRHLINCHKSEAQNRQQVDAVKVATRQAIFKRLCIARDLLHSSFADQLTLDEISHIACLSTPQLVRQFRAVFHTTPYQYLTKIRLEHAAHLLQSGDTPIHAITWQCGFENTSAFSRAFKTAYKSTPLEYREKKARRYC